MPGEMPRLGFGTFDHTDPEGCAESVRAALEMGYRHVDTAQMYDNEEFVGEGIRRADVDRDEVFLATKVHHDNLAHDDVIESTEGSLEELGVDAVDLLYVHWPRGAYDAEESLAAMDEVRDRGWTRHVGLSNFTPALLDEAREVLDAPVFAHQVEMHPMLAQGELRAYAREHDHWLVAYSPVARGRVFDEPVLVEIAGKHGATAAQVALAWIVSKENTAAIPKASGDHIRENLAALDVDLDDEDAARIDDLDRGERVVDPDDAPWNW